MPKGRVQARALEPLIETHLVHAISQCEYAMARLNAGPEATGLTKRRDILLHAFATGVLSPNAKKELLAHASEAKESLTKLEKALSNGRGRNRPLR